MAYSALYSSWKSSKPNWTFFPVLPKTVGFATIRKWVSNEYKINIQRNVAKNCCSQSFVGDFSLYIEMVLGLPFFLVNATIRIFKSRSAQSIELFHRIQSLITFCPHTIRWWSGLNDCDFNCDLSSNQRGNNQKLNTLSGIPKFHCIWLSAHSPL